MVKGKNLEDKFSRLNEKYNGFVGSEEYKLINKLKKKGYDLNAINSLANASQKARRQSYDTYNISNDHIKFLVLGDTHIGHKMYDPKLMNTAVKEGKKENVDLILCTGDIADGWYQNRPASIFEQDAIGFDNQLEKSVKEFGKFGELDKPLIYITGNHEYNTFVRGAGVEFGNIFKMRMDKLGMDNHYIGNAEGDIKLETGSKIKLLHPDGGTAYALSYKPQKIIEALQGMQEKLPNLALIGHFHKAEYLPYQGVHTFQTGTLMGQSKFMRGKGIPAMKGFWIIDLYSKKNGQVDKIIPQFYPGK